MSGSGGGGGWGGGPVDDGTPCEQLRFETTLASPDPTAVAVLRARIGQSLLVNLQAGSTAVEVVIPSSRQVAGFITERLPELIRCLQSGSTFAADVVSVTGGNVRLLVYHT